VARSDAGLALNGAQRRGYTSILQLQQTKTNGFSRPFGDGLIARMRNAKKKMGSRKKKPAKENQAPALKERIEAEFAKAVITAKAYVENPERLQPLFDDAAKQAAALPKEPFQETWPYFQTMLRLIRAYSRGDYRDVPESTLVVIIAAIIYVVNPLDVIPDALPALGFLDDATVLALAVRRSRQALDDFMIWETTARS
jgi:uncharacterized membrane protein YkvA (DUF1232 family)